MAESAPESDRLLSDAELVQRISGALDPNFRLPGADEIARQIIKLVRDNTTCIGDPERGCY